MKFDIEDPRLTAYLLGELQADQQAEVEALLQRDEEAREFVESMRLTTDALGVDLRGDAPEDGLGDIRMASIKRAAKERRQPTRWALWGGGVAVAAAAAVLVYTSFGTDNSNDKTIADSRTYQTSLRQASPASVDSTTDLERPTEKEGRATPKDVYGNLLGTEVEEIAGGWGYGVSGQSPGGGGVNKNAASPGPTRLDNTSRDIGKKRRAANGLYAPVAGNHSNLPPVDGIGATGGEMDENTRRQLESLGYFAGDIDTYTHQQEPAAVDNPFVAVATEPRSTFSIDVDTASYSQMRQALKRGSLPPASQVRVEEFLNYFSYEYPQPENDVPFGVVSEVSVAPWNPSHKLVRFGIKAKEIESDRRPRANLVFLLDVSGSMGSADKLPLLKKSFSMLLDRLDAEDHIAIVVYAGASGVVLRSTPVSRRKKILSSLQRLESGGSTNGGAGIELAYQIAQKNFIKGGVNRVILATDGDFNVGTVHQSDLVSLIEEKASHDIFLTVLGVGMSNYGDHTMELLADKGNGNYAYIDTQMEAKKVLIDQIHGTLVTVAKDVKLQVEFNPKHVAQYRLIGYENRMLANADFADDSKDAGEIGAGHTVTALYEIIPPGVASSTDLRYQTVAPVQTSAAADSGELLTLKLRYKDPTATVSKLLSVAVIDKNTRFADASVDFKFASAVAAFGMILRKSKHKGDVSLGQVTQWAKAGLGKDLHGYREEFTQLVNKARSLKR